MNWDNIVRKLTSRKLWLAVGEFVTMLLIACGADKQTATQVCALIMGGAGVIAYIVGEGLVDAMAARDTGEETNQNEPSGHMDETHSGAVH